MAMAFVLTEMHARHCSFLSGFGTLGATVFDWAVNASKALTPSNSADFSEEEWKWLGRIRRMSRGRTVVLVADNIHWWDDASFALLKKLGEARDWEEDAFLAKLKMIVVKTTDPTQMDYLGKDFDRWVERVRPERIELEKCNEGKFEEALRCFGVEARIDAPILKVLYDLSAGNLKLAKLVSQSLLDGSNAQQLAEDAASMGLLKTLLTVRRFRLALDLPLIREIAARSIKEDIFLIIDEWVNKTLNFRETKVTFGDPDAEPEYTVDTWLPQGELNELMAEYFPWLDYEYEHEIEDGSGEVEGHTLRVELNELGTGLLTVETFVEEGKEVGTLEPWYEDQSDSIVERYGSDDDWDRN